MRKIGVVPNLDKDEGLALTRAVVNWLVDKGCTPLLETEIGAQINMPQYAVDEKTVFGEAEFLVILGGDGTILRAARSAAVYGTPLLGVNLGTLGYLTDAEAGGAFEALAKAIEGRYSVEKRMMLEARLMSDGADGEAHIALNDVCIARDIFSTMITMRVTINDEYIDHYRADGFIIATPTGSTAYNLSSGGPILKPDSEMIAVTPICPHMIYARPLVISAGDVVKIASGGTPQTGGIITLDGQDHIRFAPGDMVIIRRSNYYTSIMKTNYLSFFDILRRKMIRNARD